MALDLPLVLLPTWGWTLPNFINVVPYCSWKSKPSWTFSPSLLTPTCSIVWERERNGGIQGHMVVVVMKQVGSSCLKEDHRPIPFFTNPNVNSPYLALMAFGGFLPIHRTRKRGRGQESKTRRSHIPLFPNFKFMSFMCLLLSVSFTWSILQELGALENVCLAPTRTAN